MKLKIGQTYKVQIDDCCVSGDFVAVLVKAEEYNEQDELVLVEEMSYHTSLVFDNGVTLQAMGGVSLEEIVDESVFDTQ